MVSANDEDWWWVSSCSKPSYELSTEEYKLINHKFKYPGVVTWNDVNVTIVDTNVKTLELMSGLKLSGYYPRADEFDDGISKRASQNQLDNFKIKQLNDEGIAIETWTLKNAFIKSTNFGQLDYASDELVKLELVISYDYAEFSSLNVVTDSGTINL